jgi:hypothetical protein
MDVVKIRLQSQVKPLAEGECFLFSNGLMDHLCRLNQEHCSSSGKSIIKVEERIERFRGKSFFVRIFFV